MSMFATAGRCFFVMIFFHDIFIGFVSAALFINVRNGSISAQNCAENRILERRLPVCGDRLLFERNDHAASSSNRLLR